MNNIVYDFGFFADFAFDCDLDVEATGKTDNEVVWDFVALGQWVGQIQVADLAVTSAKDLKIE